MTEKKDEPKIILQEKAVCPNCKKRLLIKKTRKVVTPGIKAEYKETLSVENDTQKTIKEAVVVKRKKK